MPKIHPTAILTGEIDLADDVEIGPYCVLSGEITLGEGVRLLQHVNLQGPLTIGSGTVIYPGAALGFEPQDYKFAPGAQTAGVTIGSECIIREHVSVHASTNLDTPTRIGNKVFMMVSSHAGHDSVVDDGVILVNGTLLAGHTHVKEKAILSGGVMVHQFCRIGRMVMCSGGTVVLGDILPFCMAAGRNQIVGLNLVGLRRSGMPKDEIDELKELYRTVIRKNPPRQELIEILAQRGAQSPAVMEMHDFLVGTKRPLASTVRRAHQGIPE
jgi:UDP-N-acetylglucosamine acyltransferase